MTEDTIHFPITAHPYDTQFASGKSHYDENCSDTPFDMRVPAIHTAMHLPCGVFALLRDTCEELNVSPRNNVGWDFDNQYKCGTHAYVLGYAYGIVANADGELSRAGVPVMHVHRRSTISVMTVLATQLQALKTDPDPALLWSKIGA